MFYPTVYWKIFFQKLTGKFQLLISFTSRLVPATQIKTDVVPINDTC